MHGKVEICGVNTASLPVLKGSETRQLLEQARQGDAAAREKLIAGNLRLVLSVVQKFAGRGESMDDLFQVGVIGLIKAVDCFDLNQNVQFSTYGVPTVNGWRKTRGAFLHDTQTGARPRCTGISCHRAERRSHPGLTYPIRRAAAEPLDRGGDPGLR